MGAGDFFSGVFNLLFLRSLFCVPLLDIGLLGTSSKIVLYLILIFFAIASRHPS